MGRSFYSLRCMQQNRGADNGIAAIKAAVIEIVDQENEDIINNAKFPNGV